MPNHKKPSGAIDPNHNLAFLKKYGIQNNQRKLIHQLGFEVFVIDKEYNIIFANRDAINRFGDYIIDKKCFAVLCGKNQREAKKPCSFCPCTEVLYDYSIKTSRYEGHEMVDQKSNIFFASETAIPLLNKANERILSINVITDITKRRKQEKLKEQLQGDYDYQQSVQIIVDGLKEIGYQRIRFYDVIHDPNRDNEILFVVRYTQGMGERDYVGYRFYESDAKYLPNIKQEKQAKFCSGKEVIAEKPNCQWIKDYELEDAKWIDVPLIVSDQLVGVITVDNKGRKEELSSEDLSLLSDFARYAAQTVVGARSKDNLKIVSEINEQIDKHLNDPLLMEVLAKLICHKMKTEMVAIFLSDDCRKKLVRKTINMQGLDESELSNLAPHEFEYCENFFGEIFQSGKTVNIIDCDEYERRSGGRVSLDCIRRYEEIIKRKSQASNKILNAIIAPVKVGEEKIGLIWIANNLNGGKVPFPDIDVTMLETVSRHIGAMQRYSELTQNWECTTKGTPDAIIITRTIGEPRNRKWLIEFANEAAHDMFGYKYGELKGMDARLGYRPEDVTKIRDIMIKEGYIKDLEVSVGHKMGHPVPISLSVSVLERDTRGNIIKSVGLSKDISARKDLERQLNELSQTSISLLGAKSLDEALFHIFESLRKIGYAKGMLSLVNEGSNVIEAKYAQGENWIKIIDETKRPLNGDDVLALVVRDGVPRLIKNCFQDRSCEQGSIRKSNIKSQFVIPLKVGNRVIGSLQIDLTDKQGLIHGQEDRLEKTKTLLQTFANYAAIAIENSRNVLSISNLQTCLAETAHEILTPFHNIITQLGGIKYYLDTEYKSDKLINIWIKIVEEETYRIKRQIDNIKYISQDASKSLRYDFKLGNIGDIIETCSNKFRERARERGINIIIRDSAKRRSQFRFDHVKMEQVYTNLIDNAIKYSWSKENVEIEGFEETDAIGISVTNKGLGIPESEYGNIFKGFTRSQIKDETRYIPGTGLGLKISKEIVEKHGGKITVKSKAFLKDPLRIQKYEGFETTFIVYLPKKPKEN